MKLPSTKISSKVRNSAISGAIVTILIGILSDTPLGESPWAAAFKNPATMGAIITLVGVLTGYSTEETAVDGNLSNGSEEIL